MIESEKIILKNGSDINSTSTGHGNGGTVVISGTESISVSQNSRIVGGATDNGDSGKFVISAPLLELKDGTIDNRTFSNGNSQSIDIDTKKLTLTEGAEIFSSTSGSGQGGVINIKSNDIEIGGGFISASSQGTGNAGDILIKADRLTLKEGVTGDRLADRASIIDSSSFGSGKSGNLTVEISDFVSISGEASGIASAASDEGDARTITIDTPLLTLIEGKITSDSSGSGNAGEIVLTVDDLTIQGGEISSNSESTDAGAGDAGDIRLTTDNVLIERGKISSATQGPGEGGNIIIKNTEDLTLQNIAIISGSAEGEVVGSGNGGDLLVHSKNVILNNGFIASDTLGQGQGGNISLVVDGVISISGSPVGGITTSSTGLPPRNGASGSVLIEAHTLNIGQGGALAAGTSNLGRGGNITIDVETLNVTGGRIDSSTLGPATGGDINIHAAQEVVLVDKGTISAGSFPQTADAGDGGKIIIEANNLRLGSRSFISTTSTREGSAGIIDIKTTGTIQSNDSVITAISQRGNAGTITINGGEDLLLANGSVVTAETGGVGNAGDIHLEAGNNIVLNKAKVSTSAKFASGGNIKLKAPNMIRLIDSLVESSVAGGDPATRGGDINIDPQFVIIQNSQVLANATAGFGGNINIVGEVVLTDRFSVLDASSQFGVSGQVDVQAPIQNLSGAIAPLSEEIVDLASLVGQHCAAQTGGQLSSFVEAGRDVVPPGPADFLTSPLFLEQSQAGNVQGANKGVGTLAAQRLGMGLGEELQITSIMKMADSSVRTRCLL